MSTAAFIKATLLPNARAAAIDAASVIVIAVAYTLLEDNKSSKSASIASISA